MVFKEGLNWQVKSAKSRFGGFHAARAPSRSNISTPSSSMEDTSMSASTEASPVLILTNNDCPGMRNVRVIGPVYGTGVRSRNIAENFLGGVRAIFGGKQAKYLKMITQTRDDALEQLAEHAGPSAPMPSGDAI